MKRWTEPGGSYRTIQRFYHNEMLWREILWIFFKNLMPFYIVPISFGIG